MSKGKDRPEDIDAILDEFYNIEFNFKENNT